MRVLLIARINFDDEGQKNIKTKLLSQQKAFEEIRHHADLLHLSKNGICKNGNTIFQKRINSQFATKYYFFNQLFKDILTLVHNDFYDILYIRYPMSTPGFTYFLWKYKKQYPQSKIVIEMPTYPYENEKKGIANKFVGWIDQSMRNRLSEYVAYIAHFGPEKSIFNIPTINIENGGNIESNKLRIAPVFDNELKLLAVGKLWDWQGIDRVINGMINYYKNKPDVKVSLTIIGEGPEKENLVNILSEISDYVSFEGAKYGSDLDYYFDSHHLAIGKLAIFRIDLAYSSALKHREYAYRGMPFIYAGNDAVLEKTANPWAKQLHNDKTPIDINELLKYYKSLTTTPEEIQNFAIQNMSWKYQMNKILEAISK
jgi:glycosyltransferase involved in cell wall biosynthesis